MSLGFDHGGNGHAEAYARAALDRECEIAASTAHGRNDQINISAFSLGQLVGGGLLDQSEVERRLYDAAVASGYVQKDGPAATRATIRSGISKGMREPRTAPTNGHAGHGSDLRNGSSAAIQIRRPAPVLKGLALPAWTPPDEDDKPKFFGIGVTEPKPLKDELRRHVYRRDGEVIRVKVKLAGGGFRDFYRVRRASDGAIGWQARKPDGFAPMPYLGAVDAFDPFDPEMLGEVLFWPEGEKDVDTLQRAGLCAFTFGGSSDVPDCSDLVRGRDLVLVADNDEPGEKCLRRKIDLVRDVAARIRTVRFPELGEGQDVSDWIEAGGAIGALLERAQDLPALWEAPDALPGSPPADAPYSIVAHPFVWRDPRTIPRRRWLYGTHLIRQFISCTVAPGGLGKTSLVLAEALAMASGRDLLGVAPRDGKLKVWVINLEDPIEESERRVAAAMLHYGIEPSEIEGQLFLNSGRDTEVIFATTTKNGTVVAQPVVDAMTAEIRAKGADVVIIDPLVKAHRVPENDNGAIDTVCTAIAKIADVTGCAFDLIHHVRKTNGAEVTVEDGRGAVALLSAARSARALNRMTKEEAENAGVVDPRLFFRSDNGKANLAPPDKVVWFKLCDTPLGNGDADRPFDNGDRVAVAEPWRWPDPLSGVTTAQLRAVQKKVNEGRFRENAQAADWVGLVVAQVVGLDAQSPADRAKIKGILKIWFRNEALVVVEGKDAKGNRRPFVEVGKWA